MGLAQAATAPPSSWQVTVTPTSLLLKVTVATVVVEGVGGPLMMVVTRGPWGAYARLRNDPDLLVIDPVTATVADTVGAGDSFMAGLISGLLDLDLLGSPAARAALAAANLDDIAPALDRALRTSGCTVTHAGAYAPTREEI